MLTTKNLDSALISFVVGCLGVFLLGGCTPAGPRALLEGDRLLQAGEHARAIEKLKLATELLPEQSQALAWNHLGVAYHSAGQPASAIAAYRQAIRRKGNLAAARFNLGCLYLEQNEWPAAVSELTVYTLLDRQAFNGWLKLGAAQLRLRQFDTAEKSFQTALQLNPFLPEALNGLGVIQLHRKRPSEALKYFHTALQKQPNYGPALLNSAILYQRHSTNLTLALQRYRDYLDTAPPPENLNAVRETVRQIELALHPPKQAALTNQLAAAPADHKVTSSSGPIPATNAVPLRPGPLAAIPASQSKVALTNHLAKVEQPTIVSNVHQPSNLNTSAGPPIQPVPPTNIPPLSPPIEKPEPPPRIEVVKLAEDPLPKVAVDVAPGAAVPETNSVAASPPSNTDAPASELASDLLIRSAPTKNKRTVVERLNPLTWFRGKSKSFPSSDSAEREVSITTIPAAEIKAETNAPGNISTNISSPSVEPAAPPPPRYRYRSPPTPPAGDRRKAELPFAQGLKAHQERRLTDAIDAYKQATKLDPSFFEAHYNLGLAAFEIKDIDQSLSAYEYALALNPASAEARYHFALALQRANYLRDTADELEKVLGNHPDETRSHFILAKLYADELGRPDLAALHYRRVLQLEPQHPQATAIRYWLAAHP